MAGKQIAAPITMNGMSADWELQKKGLFGVSTDSAMPGVDYVSILYRKDVSFPKQKTITGKVTTGVPEGGEWDGVSIVEPVGFTDLYNWTAIHRMWKNAIQFNFEAKLYDTYDVLKDRATEFRNSFYYSRQKLAWKFFNDGYSVNAPDGVPFFSDSHPNAIGGTWSNIISGGLTVSSLADAITMMRTMKDPMGNPQYLTPTILWVNEEQLMYARQIYGGDMKTEYGNDTIRNAFNDISLQIKPTPYFASDTQWMLQGSKIDTFWDDLMPTVIRQIELDNESVKHEGKFVWANWCRSGKGFVGSAG